MQIVTMKYEDFKKLYEGVEKINSARWECTGVDPMVYCETATAIFNVNDGEEIRINYDPIHRAEMKFDTVNDLYLNRMFELCMFLLGYDYTTYNNRDLWKGMVELRNALEQKEGDVKCLK